MQSIAKDVGYSETAFAHRSGDAWRVRYFAPGIEVPFCGHATLALGAVLAERYGDGAYKLILNDGAITIDAKANGSNFQAAFVSPETKSEQMAPNILAEIQNIFHYSSDDIRQEPAPAIINAGASHGVLFLNSHKALQSLTYDLETGRDFMLKHGLITIAFIFIENNKKMHARNAFAAGGVLEDPGDWRRRRCAWRIFTCT